MGKEPTTPTLEEIIGAAVEHRLLDVHTGQPAVVTSYDADAKTVDVLPQLARILDDDNDEKVVEAMPQIFNVPVKFPGTGSFVITWPIEEGDTGWIDFAERNIGQWQETGEGGDPGDLGMHELSGASFYPGLRHSGNVGGDTDASAMVIGAPQLKLGSSSAAHPMLFGDTYNAEESTLMGLMLAYFAAMTPKAAADATAWAAVAAALPPAAGPATAAATAAGLVAAPGAALALGIPTFLGKALTWLSQKIKGE